jgi:hypothetical protein
MLNLSGSLAAIPDRELQALRESNKKFARHRPRPVGVAERRYRLGNQSPNGIRLRPAWPPCRY